MNIQGTILIKSILVISIMLFTSCGQRRVDVSDYLSFLNDENNGLGQKHQLDGVEYSLKFIPLDYAILLDIGADKLDESKLKQLRNEQTGVVTFQFLIKPLSGEYDALERNANQVDNSDARISYLIGHINEDFQLIGNNGTFPCSLHHYERLYNKSAGHKVMLCFEVENYEKLIDGDEIKVVFNDRALGTGRLIYKFKTNTLKSIPILKL